MEDARRRAFGARTDLISSNLINHHITTYRSHLLLLLAVLSPCTHIPCPSCLCPRYLLVIQCSCHIMVKEL